MACSFKRLTANTRKDEKGADYFCETKKKGGGGGGIPGPEFVSLDIQSVHLDWVSRWRCY